MFSETTTHHPALHPRPSSKEPQANRSAPTRWGARVMAAAVALGVSMAAGIAPAFAHDTLISSTPEADETLLESPEEVVLEFSGAGLTTGAAISNDIVVLDEEGENWASSEPAEVEGSTMRTDLPDALPDGEYEITYRVVYSDGHDEENSFGFTVELEDQPEPTVQSSADVEDEAADGEEETPAQEEASAEPSESEVMPAPSPSSDTEDAVSSGLSTSTVVVLSLGALAVIGVAAVLLFRRRRGGQSSC